MDDYKVLLGAIIEANTVQDRLDAMKNLSVKIQNAEISQSAIDHIKKQLSSNGIDLKLVFGNTNQIQKQAQQVGQQVGQQIQNGISSVIQKGSFKKDFLFSAKDQNNVAKEAQKYFRSISDGIVTVQERMADFEGKSSLNGFVVNIKNAKGEIESLRYSLRNLVDDSGNVTGQTFAYTGGSINDSGAVKQIREIERVYADYTKKIEQFKSTNKGILDGLSKPLSEFEANLTALKNGSGSIDTVKNSFSLLGAEALKISSNLKGTDSSLNEIANAINKIATGKETIASLTAEFKGLQNQPQEVAKELTNVSQLLDEVLKLESTVGHTEQWAETYHKWATAVTDVTAKITTLQTQEKNSATTQLLDIGELDKQGRLYRQKIQSTVEESRELVEGVLRKYAKDNNIIPVDIKVSGIEDANGKVQKLKASLEDVNGIVHTFNFDRARFASNNSKGYNEGFVQVGDIQTSQRATKSFNDTLTELRGKLETAKSEWKDSGILAGEFGEKVTQLETALSNVGSKGDLKGLNTTFRELNSEATKLTKTKGVTSDFTEIKNSWQEQGLLVGDFATKVEEVSNALANVSSKSGLDKVKSDIQGLISEADKLKSANAIKLSVDNGTYDAQVATLISKTNQWTDANGNAVISTQALTTALDKLTTATSTYNSSPTQANTQALIEAENQLKLAVEATNNEVRKRKAEYATDDEVAALHQKAQEFKDKNSAAMGRWGKDINDILAKTTAGSQVLKTELDGLNGKLIETINAARQAGKLGDSVFKILANGMKKFSYWTSSTFVVMQTIQQVKKAVSFSRELDDALTNINYTMNVSENRLRGIGDAALQTAKDLNTSSKNVLAAVTTYANANETADSIIKKSKPTIMLSNVTGMDTATTTDILQGTIHQFDLEDTEESLMHVSDVLQTVSQSMAVDFSRGVQEMSEGIKVSGSVAKDAGYDLENYSALLGNLIEKTRQSGSELGRSLRTMFVRTTKASSAALAGGEVTEDDLSNAETALGRVGIAVRDNIDSFRDFDDIMTDLYNKVDDLSEVDLSNIAYEVASTRQTAVFKMMIKSWGEYMGLAEKAQNADGVTLQNQEKYADSLSGTFKELTANAEAFYDAIINDEALKTLSKIGSGFLNILTTLTKISPLLTVGAGAGIFAGINNIGKSIRAYAFRYCCEYALYA